MEKEKGDTDTLLKVCKFCKIKCSNKECKLVTNKELLILFRKSGMASFPKFLDKVLYVKEDS
jgi:hypothetical protein